MTERIVPVVGEVYVCLRCGHSWVSRPALSWRGRPARCAKCRSPYWDRPRQETAKQEVAP
jgi:DNA-directed RNA polymerase subunit RPC12/RpoP